MPVHEFSPFTKAAVNSVLNQSYGHLELVIIGKDDVDALLARLPGDSRITGYSRNAPGIIGALNTGLGVCNGNYIARMDSDDICHPDRLRLQLDFLVGNPNIGLAGACVELFSDENSIGRGNQEYQRWLNSLTTPKAISDACLIESPLPHPSLFAHRSYWETMGPYRDRGWPEDYDLVLRTWLAGIAMAKPPDVLLKWREHPERLTHTDERYSRQAFIRAKAWALLQPDAGLGVDTGRNIWICGTGRNARHWHDALIENKAKILGFVELDSAKQKTQKRHLPVITYEQLARCKQDALIVSAVSGASARKSLVDWFTAHHMDAGVDYVLGG